MIFYFIVIVNYLILEYFEVWIEKKQYCNFWHVL